MLRRLLQRIKQRTKRRRTSTVRYMFPALLSSLTALGLLALAPAAVPSGSHVYLEAPTLAVKQGEIVPVAVMVSAAAPINAVELEVGFDEAHVDVFGVDRGQSVLTIWTEDPIVTNDTVTFRGGTFKRGFLGAHQIATINFRATKTGQHTIAVSGSQLIAGDGNGTEVAAEHTAAESLRMFVFDDNTSEEEMKVAISSSLTGDLTGDGKLTLRDVSAFMGAWSNRSAVHDFDGDGRMTFTDFSILLANYFLR